MADEIYKGPRFRLEGNDWKPVFNIFDKPVICTEDESATDKDIECCDPCLAWIDCLNRSPLRIKLDGFNFKKWFRYIRFNAEAWFLDDNIAYFPNSNGDPEYQAFAGTYIFEPWQGSGRSQCGPFSTGTLESGRQQCGTHFWRGWRTVFTNGYFSQIKRFYLEAKAECVRCVQDAIEFSCLRFNVYLNFEQELWSSGVNVLEPFCAAKRLPASHKTRACCTLLQSDPIPMESLTWEALQNIRLRPADCRACYITDSTFGPPCSGLMLHRNLCTGEIINECDPDAVVPPQDCLPNTSDFERCDTIGALYCPPPAIEVLGAATGSDDNRISVLADSCDFIQNCGYCLPPPGKPEGTVGRPIEIDFTFNPVSCCKTFRAVVPDCLEVENEDFYWSFGKTGRTVSYCLQNIEEGTLANKNEQITLIVKDKRGCIYCKTKAVGCNCPCPSASATVAFIPVSPTPLEKVCKYDICYTISWDQNDDGCSPYIEFDFSGGSVPCSECDPQRIRLFCKDRGIQGEESTEALIAEQVDAPNGTDCYRISIEGPKLVRWRVWDAVCGCAGPWNQQLLPCELCECCEGPLKGAKIRLNGYSSNPAGFGCQNCDCSPVNAEYDVPLTFGCGGTKIFPNVYQCGNLPVDLTASWSINCDENGYWLTAVVRFGTEILQEDFFLGTVKPDCKGKSGSINVPSPFPTCCRPARSSQSISIETY